MSPAPHSRSRITKPTCALVVAALVILTIGIGMLIYSQYQGRAISRILGIANHVPLPACVHRPEQVISISFHNDPKGGTLKDVTYTCDDGRMYSKEYTDFGILQGEIEWTYDRQSTK